MAGLRLLHPELPDATVTAGNSAGLNDAAAVVGVAGAEFAAAHGLTPLARIRSWASVGIEPALTGMAPTLAIPKALDRAGISLGDVTCSRSTRRSARFRSPRCGSWAWTMGSAMVLEAL